LPLASNTREKLIHCEPYLTRWAAPGDRGYTGNQRRTTLVAKPTIILKEANLNLLRNPQSAFYGRDTLKDLARKFTSLGYEPMIRRLARTLA